MGRNADQSDVGSDLTTDGIIGVPRVSEGGLVADAKVKGCVTDRSRWVEMLAANQLGRSTDGVGPTDRLTVDGSVLWGAEVDAKDIA